MRFFTPCDRALHLALFFLCFAGPAHAHDGVLITGAFARSAGSSASVYFAVENHQAVADTLLAATSNAAAKTRIHTAAENADGVMAMSETTLPVPAPGTLTLQPGQHHIMLMGLNPGLAKGDTITLTLTFERAGAVTVVAELGGTAAAMTDAAAIASLLQAQFATPDDPAHIGPIVIEGDHALAGWIGGAAGGRALLLRAQGQWQILLWGGATLRQAEVLAVEGVVAAETLSARYNAAEAALGSDAVALFSAFEGVERSETLHVD